MMQNWDEIRTAYQVARMGTVSGAAEAMGVHHATVIRHIDALEKRLGTKLFQRHARGYTPTEAGRDLLAVAQTTDEQFAQLSNRIKGQGEIVSGEIVLTSITGMADLLIPALGRFQARHPDLTVRFLSDMRLFRLDYGEAHVAIRAGAAPQEPDNVVQPLMRIKWGMYAARSYADAHGIPKDPSDFAHHRFVGHDELQTRVPFYRWLRDHVPPAAISFRVLEPEAGQFAVRAGLGIGFLPIRGASDDLGVVEVMAPRPEWETPLWLVTHVDLHRTLKVQSLLAHLKEEATAWGKA